MSDREIMIPKYANAGVAFAGVEFDDVYLIFAGVIFGVIAAGFFHLGLIGFPGIPLVCFVINTWYLDWKESATPGQLRALMFRLGILGYSPAFPTANLIYVGDSKALHPGSRSLHIEDEVDASEQAEV